MAQLPNMDMSEWECFHGNSTLDMQVDTFLMWYKYRE